MIQPQNGMHFHHAVDSPVSKDAPLSVHQDEMLADQLRPTTDDSVTWGEESN